MKEFRINSTKELFDLLYEFRRNRTWAFRGQGDSSWKLLPKSGREEFASKYTIWTTEKSILDSWKRYAVHFLRQTPTDEWDWLALAQHHGLATRLLDWTRNPLNAAFFAVASCKGQDSAVYAFELLKSDVASELDPFEEKDLKIYSPRGLSARIISQRGIFTISGPPTTSIEELLGDRLYKITIAESIASDIKQTLELFGVNVLSIYQDLDHLSEYLNDFILTRESESMAILNKDIPFG